MKKLILPLFLSVMSCAPSENAPTEVPQAPKVCDCTKTWIQITRPAFKPLETKEEIYATEKTCEPETPYRYFIGSNGLEGENAIFIQNYYEIKCPK